MPEDSILPLVTKGVHEIFGLENSVSITVLILHGPSMFAVKAKNYGVLYNQASTIAFDVTSSYWSALKSS